MGPRSCERGNRATVAMLADALRSLQWGRAHVSAETSGMCMPVTAALSLQWGRAHVSAETPATSTVDARRRCVLQWGRAHVSAETMRGHGLRLQRVYGFNGAALM